MLTHFPPAHGPCPVRQMNCKWLWQIWFSPEISWVMQKKFCSQNKLAGEENVSTVQLQRRYNLKHGTTGFSAWPCLDQEDGLCFKCGKCVTRLFHALHSWHYQKVLASYGWLSLSTHPPSFIFVCLVWWAVKLRKYCMFWGKIWKFMMGLVCYLFDWAMFCGSSCKGLAWMELHTSHF